MFACNQYVTLLVSVQARCRGFLVRREFNRRNWATTTIQAYARGMIARRRYKKMKVSTECQRGIG